jgi:branched-chain amino acid aminotransferase
MSTNPSGRTVWINGKYVPEHEAGVSIFDSALMYGDMIFEMARSFNRIPFRLREHLDRLYRSAKLFRIQEPMPVDDLEKVVHEVIEKNRPFMDEDDEDRPIINLSRGPLSIYWPIFGGPPGPTLIVGTFPLSLTMGALGYLYENGVHAVVPSQRALPAELIDPKAKNRSRLHYMVANLQVGQVDDPNSWALLLDTDGFVTEGTGANFFIVTGGELWTPEPRNILVGVSRNYTIELAKKLGIPVREKNFGVYEVIQADEAFYTSTPFSVLPCTKIDGIDIGTGLCGPVTQRVIDAWSESVGVDIVAQAKRFADRNAAVAQSGPTPYRMENRK